MTGTPVITASTKRNPAAVAGKVGIPTTHLATVTLAFPPVPVSPETAEKYQLKSPRKSYITGVKAAADIQEGDTVTVGGVDYRVRAVGGWTSPVVYTELILEVAQV